MNALLILSAAMPSTGSLLGLLFYVAIAAVVIWAIVALVKWSGIPIPQPVWIIFTALVCILLIVLLFRFFGLLI